MSDPNDIAPGPAQDHDDETPMQRALRLKQAALDARPKAPRGGRFQRQQASRVATGNSRPWGQR
ncbi:MULTISPECIES: hypothetical protein [unclassified Caulobacter]|uniref:hypothetical protein n=1 Tax=unclassified Caulobacter TaxID=2648921 RepID=UPI0006FB4C5D|nr:MULTISPECIES: hypothetical protein [unclassified Caulobacter]KQV62187.1 hypothetical protein ASC62_01225 [Caulobacter sp. Root342]KQV63107.1 hypothetical protein ASC70_22140 [Caulobacter sp. Root343]